MSEPQPLEAWIGRSETVEFRIDPWPAAALTAALGQSDPPRVGAPLPPFWHHLYGLPVVSSQQTGPDGHVRRGGFLPPVPLPRRMWAGGRLDFLVPLRIGDEVSRASEVKAITRKAGRQGPLVFVLVEYRLATSAGLCLVEEHDIVYRGPSTSSDSSASVATSSDAGSWQHRWTPDEVLLFRYSALIYNAHRIHYDHRYVTEVEGYPGLIVHGPLLATFMLDLVRKARSEARVRRFEFRALAPLFVGEELTVHGQPTASGIGLWITGPDGRIAMRGAAQLA